mgnify:CR=1 FL=1
MTTNRTLLILTLIVFCNSANSFSQVQPRSAAEFEKQGAAAQRSGNCNDAIKYYAELGQVCALTGDKTGAMQRYYVLQNLNPRLAAQLLEQIPK